jgi:hypothetical protein
MRLYRGQIEDVSRDLLEALLDEAQLEVSADNESEVEKDIESVLSEYIRLDRELYDTARDIAADQGGKVGKIRNKLEREKDLNLQEDPIGYITDQLIETFFHSRFVDEVFAADNELTVTMRPILEDYMTVEEELDEEVRDKIKNLEEDSQEWEVEYEKVMSNLKETRDLE